MSFAAGRWHRLASHVASPGTAGAAYVLVAISVIFSIWVPDRFPRWITMSTSLNDNAIMGLVAMGLVVCLAAREFDLSVGFMLGSASVFFAWLLGNTSLPVAAAVALTMLFAALVGAFNGFLVVVVGIDSFIATLATGSLLQALISVMSDGGILTEGVERADLLADTPFLGLGVSVIVLLVLTVVIWLVMEHTPLGRKIYATGLGREAADLSGIRTRRIRFGSLLVSALTAGMAGIFITSHVGAAAPDTGPAYLIPAFAAVFLGSTQIKPGLFNAWGTLLAVLLLGILNTGLALVGVPTWVPYVSTGGILILALAGGLLHRRGAARQARRHAEGAYKNREAL